MQIKANTGEFVGNLKKILLNDVFVVYNEIITKSIRRGNPVNVSVSTRALSKHIHICLRVKGLKKVKTALTMRTMAGYNVQ